MKLLETDQIDALANASFPIALSLLMPTFSSCNQADQNIHRFKTLLDQAEVELDTVAAEKEQIEIIRPTMELLEDRYFWESQDQGLVFYLAEGCSYFYRLPFDPGQSIRFCKRFFLEPVELALFEEQSAACWL